MANSEEEFDPAAMTPASFSRAADSANQLSLRAVPLAAFALLAVFQFMPMIRAGTAAVVSNNSVNQEVVRRAWACQTDTLPAAVGSLQREKFMAATRDQDNIMGNYSRTYEYRGSSGIRHVASCDFPYLGGWHELTVCYRGLGWQLVNRRIEKNSQNVDGVDWQHMEADFSKPDGTFGFLLASAFDNSGRCMDLPTNSIIEDALSVLTSRKKKRHGGLTFQVQVWTTAGRPITQEERQDAQRLFLAARKRFFRQVAGLESPVSAVAPQ